MSKCGRRVTLALVWLLSLVLFGFVCWKIAPSEKLTYQTVQPKAPEIDIKVGDRGYVDYGSHKNDLATVQAISPRGDVVIKLDSGQTIQVPKYNWIPLEK